MIPNRVRLHVWLALGSNYVIIVVRILINKKDNFKFKRPNYFYSCFRVHFSSVISTTCPLCVLSDFFLIFHFCNICKWNYLSY